MLRRSTIVLLVAGIALLIIGLPMLVGRLTYTHAKRLRAVVDGKVYRAGQLTTQGISDAVHRYGIRTIVNLQEDNQDPAVARGYFDRRTVRESVLCEQLGVSYKLVLLDLVSPRSVDQREVRPSAIEDFLRIMDREENYPVLFHCKAGLHRTGVLAAVYRMEYQGWTPHEAYEELKAHGYGNHSCTAANEYVRQYVLNYRPGQRRGLAVSTDVR